MKVYEYVLKFRTSIDYSNGDLVSRVRRGFNSLFSTVEEIDCVKTVIDDRVAYPKSGALTIKRVDLSFNYKVSKDKVEDIINYWGAITYVGRLEMICWENNQAKVWVDVSKTTSENVGARNILELLLDFLENGTPFKVDNTQTIKGLGGNTVKTVVGLT